MEASAHRLVGVGGMEGEVAWQGSASQEVDGSWEVGVLLGCTLRQSERLLHPGKG